MHGQKKCVYLIIKFVVCAVYPNDDARQVLARKGRAWTVKFTC